MVDGSPRIFIETWNSDFGPSDQIEEADETSVYATIPEGEPFGFRTPTQNDARPVAFIDGIQQIEAYLSQAVGGHTVRGVVCAHAVGAVTISPGESPVFAHVNSKRLVIWASGATGNLPAMPGGWSWEECSVPDTGPTAAKEEMVRQRRVAEAALAHRLDDEGWAVVADGTDGTLYTPRRDGSQRRIIGCIKSHRVQLLPNPFAQELPRLPVGQRTTLFRTPSNRFSCYFRLGNEPRPWQAPLTGIIRLEFSGGYTLAEARVIADAFTSILPAYAGVEHRDTRAPQNLLPIGALESHLRRTLGDTALAKRAIHDAVAHLVEG